MNKETIISTVVGLGILTYISLGIDMGETLPGNAMVLVDYVQEEYVTVPCILQGNTVYPYITNLEEVRNNGADPIASPSVATSTIAEARSHKFKPDIKCGTAGGFVTKRPWLFTLLGLGRHRVDPDGTVLW